ncbi:hypothetical protein ACIRRA_43215 [Nocardia sp. NPDC101769]|uniref:hypothetical protein n=1 Tax=Nocardia sp. NPDC101769 TaxID=3364333 RepID=UPI0038234969
MGITFATQNPGGRVAGLHHFNYEPLSRLAVAPVGGGKAPAGDYLVFGRVVIANFDDDFQEAGQASLIAIQVDQLVIES